MNGKGFAVMAGIGWIVEMKALRSREHEFVSNPAAIDLQT